MDTSILRPALVLFGALTLICGVLYPLAVTGIGQRRFRRPGRRQPASTRRQAGRLGADRPGVLAPEVFLGPAVGHRPDAVQRRRLRRLATRGRPIRR